jgi:hypothetical protein
MTRLPRPTPASLIGGILGTGLPRCAASYFGQTLTTAWHTGRTRAGYQALTGVDWNAMVCLLFDLDGRYIRCVERFFSATGEATDTPVTTTPFHLREEEGQIVDERFDAWMNEACEEPITVEAFHHDTRSIGVQAEPEHYQDDLDNLDADTRAILERDRLRWREDRDFVFWWNEDYMPVLRNRHRGSGGRPRLAAGCWLRCLCCSSCSWRGRRSGRWWWRGVLECDSARKAATHPR